MPIDWPSFLQLLEGRERVVISSHVRPDADALGSEIGLAAFLRNRGKQVRIINPSATPPHLKFLDPQGLIQEIGQGVTVDEAAQADLHVIVDTSAWQQLCDVGNVFKHTPAQKVVIDHHLSSDDLGAVEFKDVSAAATGVLITELIEAAGDDMSLPQSEALFAAIATDTGWFRFSNTDARTLLAAARLIDHGVRPNLLYRELYERSSLARLKLHSIALGRATLACQGMLAFTMVTLQDFLDTGALPSDTEELVNVCLTVEGVQAAFILVEQPDGRMKASLRSRCELSVAAIAERFGGGGHRQAAGVVLPGPLLAAEEALLKAFQQSFSEKSC
jgi:phosphoesterase RecJ-like protein